MRPSSRGCASAGAISARQDQHARVHARRAWRASARRAICCTASSHNPYDLTRSTAGSSGGAGAIGRCRSRRVRHRLRLGWVDSRPVAQQRHRRHQAHERARAAHRAHRRLRRRVRPLAAARTDGAARRGPRAHHADHQRPGLSRRLVCAGAVGRSAKRSICRSSRSRTRTTTAQTGENATDEDTKKTVGDAVGWLRGTVASVQHDVPTEVLLALNDARRRAHERRRLAVLSALGRQVGHQELRALASREHEANLEPLSSTADLIKAWEDHDHGKSRMLAWMSAYDVFICPTSRTPAQPIDQEGNGGGGAGARGPVTAWQYTGSFNSTGWPSVVVRCGSSADGKLPIGLQVVDQAVARGHRPRGRGLSREQVRRLDKAADLTSWARAAHGFEALRGAAAALFVLVAGQPSIAAAELDVVETTIADLQRAILSKETTASEIVRLYLARIRAYNGTCVEGARRAPRAHRDDSERGPDQRAADVEPAAGRARGVGLRRAQGAQHDGRGRRRPEHARCARGRGRARRCASRATGKLVGPLHGVVIAIKDQFDTFDMRTTSGADAFYANDRPPDDATFVARLRAGRRDHPREGEHGRVRGRRPQLVRRHVLQPVRHRALARAARAAARARPWPRIS